MKKEGLLFVVSGASGSGKTTLCRAILKVFPRLYFSVSYTTRPKRPREKNRRDYYFISPGDFQRKIDRGDFAEWAEIYGHRYGTSKKILERVRGKGRDVILDIDSQGARQIRNQNLPGIFIFILPPSLGELKRRLKNRQSEAGAALEERLKKARNEIAQAGWYDYVIINDDLKKARENLKAIILAEHCRRARLTWALERLIIKNR